MFRKKNSVAAFDYLESRNVGVLRKKKIFFKMRIGKVEGKNVELRKNV